MCTFGGCARRSNRINWIGWSRRCAAPATAFPRETPDRRQPPPHGIDVDFCARAVGGHFDRRLGGRTVVRTHLGLAAGGRVSVSRLAAAQSAPSGPLAQAAFADRSPEPRRHLGRYHRSSGAPAPAQAVSQTAARATLS